MIGSGPPTGGLPGHSGWGGVPLSWGRARVLRPQHLPVRVACSSGGNREQPEPYYLPSSLPGRVHRFAGGGEIGVQHSSAVTAAVGAPALHPDILDFLVGVGEPSVFCYKGSLRQELLGIRD